MRVTGHEHTMAHADHRSGRHDDGFTLIEVLVALLILVSGLLALLGLLDLANRTTTKDKLRQNETNLAREVLEDARNVPYTSLHTSAIAGALTSVVPGATVSGQDLNVTRAGFTFDVSFSACSMDDPSNGYGDYSSPPQSGGTWCADNVASGITNAQPDDYKRVTATVTPTGVVQTPSVQETALIYAPPGNGPAVSCLTTNASCPGTNLTITSGTSQTFTATTSTQAASIQWLDNGNPPTSGEVPGGAFDPYAPSGLSSSFTWNFPTPDGSFAISATAYNANGDHGTPSTIVAKLNRHQVIAPSSLIAGWDPQVNGVDVQWVPSTDHDVLYYKVYRQVGNAAAQYLSACSAVNGLECIDQTANSPGTEPATCTATRQSFTTTSYYWVVGFDTDPVTGSPRESTATSPKLDANLCNHPPPAPTALAGTSSGGQITLTWVPDPSGDPDTGDSVQDWRIYRWQAGPSSPQFPGSRYSEVGSVDSRGLPVTSFTDTSPDPGGQAQSYCVTAVDKMLAESPCSPVYTG
jgi:prepilin-type N-terminal cleavage/methylation domain-containing protein